MSDLMRRLRASVGETDPEQGRGEAEGAAHTTDDSSPAGGNSEGSGIVARGKENDSSVERAERDEAGATDGSEMSGEAEARAGEGGGGNLHRIGDEVASVLQSAHAAAGDMRAGAHRDAERIRSEAESAADRLLADAQREAQAMRQELHQLRDEADKYAKAAREEAEAYAVETRRTAEVDASRKEAEAEEGLRAARAAAKRIEKEATAEASRRKSSLEAEASRFEERLANILTIFRGVAVQLEDVLQPRSNGEQAREQRPASDDGSLEDALQPDRSRQGARGDAQR